MINILKKNIATFILCTFMFSCGSLQADPRIGYPLAHYELFGDVYSVTYVSYDAYSFESETWRQAHFEPSGFDWPYSVYFDQDGYQIEWQGLTPHNEGSLYFIYDESGDLKEYTSVFPDPKPISFPQLNRGEYELYNGEKGSWRILRFGEGNIYDGWGERIVDGQTVIFWDRRADSSVAEFIDYLSRKEEHLSNPSEGVTYTKIFYYDEQGLLTRYLERNELIQFDDFGVLQSRTNFGHDNERYEIISDELHVRTFNAGFDYQEIYNFVRDEKGNWTQRIFTVVGSDGWRQRYRIRRLISYY